MLFNSFDFAIFFLIVTPLFFMLPHRWRWALLLSASCFFYMSAVPIYILILGLTIVVDYFAGILIEGSAGGRRKAYLVASLVANIGALVVFKYYNFLNDNLTQFLGWFNWPNHVPGLKMALPIGLSFHTFQAMSYTIEVYRGNQKAERHFGIYALYVMFYPQLVAGPIERPQNILHQFREKHALDWQRIANGLKLMAWGLFKKVVIADHLAAMVDEVYNNPYAYDSSRILSATLAFAFQIYCDFSGYSDIALGAAEVMGFRLMKNFDRPYLSQSIGEFWRRWHISLSTWFRDYVYIPLGGSKTATGRCCLNLMITFLISGVWHGAKWTFVVWGGLNGLLLIYEMLTKNIREQWATRLGLDRFPLLRQSFRTMTTFSLIGLTWVFFRANTLNDAFFMTGQLFSCFPGNLLQVSPTFCESHNGTPMSKWPFCQSPYCWLWKSRNGVGPCSCRWRVGLSGFGWDSIIA